MLHLYFLCFCFECILVLLFIFIPFYIRIFEAIHHFYKVCWIASKKIQGKYTSTIKKVVLLLSHGDFTSIAAWYISYFYLFKVWHFNTEFDLAGRMDPYVLIQYKGQERKSSVARGKVPTSTWLAPNTST